MRALNNYHQTVLNELLDKYEDSAHYKKNGDSNRRVILKCNSKNIPTYRFDDADIRDDFNQSMSELKEKDIIDFSWERKGFIIKEVWLRLENLTAAYKMIDRSSKESLVQAVANVIYATLQVVTIQWIRQYLTAEYSKTTEKKSLSGVWKNEFPIVEDLLAAITKIDSLNGEEISMRVFSVNLFGNSKHFEHCIKTLVVPIVKKNEPFIREVDDEDIDERTILAQVGIIMMPEIFEFCGNASMQFKDGMVDVSPMKRGTCISSDSMKDLERLILGNIDKIIFIENKTNYSEYNMKHRKENELTVYHGGFYSPARGAFFSAIKEATGKIPIYFWGDIDYGGFKMYARLKRNIVPSLEPLYMSENEYSEYLDYGIEKSSEYIKKVDSLSGDSDFSVFQKVINLVIQNKKIVEQENLIANYFEK